MDDDWFPKIFIMMMAIALIFLIIAGIFLIFQYFYWDYPISRDVWDNLDRAQTSAEVETMLIYTNTAINNLENYKGLFSNKPQTQGHCALIFKKPSNDLSVQYNILQNIRTRLERTMTFDKNGVEYQTAIDDIRGTIRELPYIYCWVWHFD